MNINLERLCRRLNYQFNNINLLKQALSHRSVGPINYERFEFLGDSILSFVIAHELFVRFPEQSEGQLSKLRSSLVRGDMLTELAKELNLGDNLILGQGELKSGGFRRASILADALEAIFAAVFFDGGMASAQQVITQIYETRLAHPDLINSLKDTKTQLQEYVQAQKYALPLYHLIKIEGEEHEQVFHVTCEVPGVKKITYGEGVNRKKAEQAAAESLLGYLQGLKK